MKNMKMFFKRNRDSEFYVVDCQLCGVTGLQGEAINTHKFGKKHQKKMSNLPIMTKNRQVISGLFEIAKNQDKPLIGIDYVAEIVDKNSREINFSCILCDKNCNTKSIISHLVSHRHRMNYLNVHFEKFMKTLNENKTFNENMNDREEILSLMSREIQNKIGLTHSKVIEKTFFENDKRKVEESIRNVNHFSQHDWPECISIFEKILHQTSKKLESFQNAFDAKILKSDAIFDHLKKNPENHPKYREEWQKFWYNKFKDLQKQEVDPNSYDYKPEWMILWSRKLEEMRDKEVAEVKKTTRMKFELCKNKSDSSDDDPPSKRYRRNSLEHEVDHHVDSGCHKATGPVTLISVCSLLTALEPELGLLAQSTVELLSKSVALEKSKPSTSNDLLEDSKISNLLDTVREKLKGILSANIIESNRIGVVRQAIQNIAILMHEHGQRAASKNHLKSKNIENEASLNDSTNNLTADPVTKVKMEIAKAITENLKQSGRSDISAEQLESLVEEFFKDVDEGKTLKENEPSEIAGNNKDNVETLSDEDLETLLRNFSDLNAEEQIHLNNFLHHLEKDEPEKVQKLRMFVNLG